MVQVLFKFACNSDILIFYGTADLCCGKGFLGMLLSYLAAICPALQKIKCIVLAEKNKSINWHHVEAANEDFRKRCSRDIIEDSDDSSTLAAIPITVWKGADLHSNTFLRSIYEIAPNQPEAELSKVEKSSAATAIQNQQRVDTPAFERTEVSPQHDRKKYFYLVGIHLCRRLSSRFIELTNSLGVQCTFAALAPCCLPHYAGGGRVRIKQEGQPLSLLLANENKQREQALAKFYNCWKCGAVGHNKYECTEIAADTTKALDVGVAPTGSSKEVAGGSIAPVVSAKSESIDCSKKDTTNRQHVQHQTKIAQAQVSTASPPDGKLSPVSELAVKSLQVAPDPFKVWVDFLFNSLVDTTQSEDLPDGDVLGETNNRTQIRKVNEHEEYQERQEQNNQEDQGSELAASVQGEHISSKSTSNARHTIFTKQVVSVALEGKSLHGGNPNQQQLGMHREQVGGAQASEAKVMIQDYRKTTWILMDRAIQFPVSPCFSDHPRDQGGQ